MSEARRLAADDRESLPAPAASAVGRRASVYVVRRLSLSSIARYGCLLGGVAALIPSLLCGLAGLWGAAVMRRWLESWQEVRLNLLGRDLITLDFISLLHLNGLLRALQSVDARFAVVALALILALALVIGLIVAVTVSLVGWTYNLVAAATGGVEVQLVERDTGSEAREARKREPGPPPRLPGPS